MGIFAIGVTLHSQVGINTKNPQGILHVDVLNNTSGTTNDLDDVIVTQQGYVGIGTVSPQAPLHIHTSTAGTDTSNPDYGFKLVDGSEADKRALVSDANGLASWSIVKPEGGVSAIRGAGIGTTLVDDPTFYNTGTYITLPKGKWLVNVMMYVTTRGTPLAQNDERYTIQSSFSETNAVSGTSAIISADIEGDAFITTIAWKSSPGGIMSGNLIINNPVASRVYYFYMGNIVVYGTQNTAVKLATVGGPKGEDNIVAFRLPQNL